MKNVYKIDVDYFQLKREFKLLPEIFKWLPSEVKDATSLDTRAFPFPLLKTSGKLGLCSLPSWPFLAAA